VHAIHVGAAALAFHRILGRRRLWLLQRGDDRRDDKTWNGFARRLIHPGIIKRRGGCAAVETAPLSEAIESYRPQPIWFATNHSAIIDTGTPSNHATPYFISHSSRTIL
jgi:hypothetical protein